MTPKQILAQPPRVLTQAQRESYLGTAISCRAADPGRNTRCASQTARSGPGTWMKVASKTTTTKLWHRMEATTGLCGR